MYKNIFSLLFLIFVISTAFAQSNNVVLDRRADRESDAWTRIACFYGESGDDFFGGGCYHPGCEDGNNGCTDDEVTKGLWKPCYSNFCEFVYYGAQRPKPTAITIRGNVKGNSVIKVGAKRSPNNLYYEEIGQMEPTDGWQEHTIDLTVFPNAFVLNITMDQESEDNFVMIDSIVVHVP